MQLTFICGCKTGEVVDRANLATMDSVIVDDEGMLVCGIHHQRRVGWRSIPGWSFASWSPAEVEGFVLFGEAPRRRQLNLTKTIEDTRDVRDPEEVGKSLLAAGAGATSRLEQPSTSVQRVVVCSQMPSNWSGSVLLPAHFELCPWCKNPLADHVAISANAESYCDEATDSGHSSSHGLG